MYIRDGPAAERATNPQGGVKRTAAVGRYSRETFGSNDEPPRPGKAARWRATGIPLIGRMPMASRGCRHLPFNPPLPARTPSRAAAPPPPRAGANRERAPQVGVAPLARGQGQPAVEVAGRALPHVAKGVFQRVEGRAPGATRLEIAPGDPGGPIGDRRRPAEGGRHHADRADMGMAVRREEAARAGVGGAQVVLHRHARPGRRTIQPRQLPRLAPADERGAEPAPPVVRVDPAVDRQSDGAPIEEVGAGDDPPPGVGDGDQRGDGGGVVEGRRAGGVALGQVDAAPPGAGADRRRQGSTGGRADQRTSRVMIVPAQR